MKTFHFWAFLLFYLFKKSDQQLPGEICAPEGSISQRVNVFYKCDNKVLVLAGCVGQNSTRVPINKNYTAQGYDMKCVPVGSMWAQLVPIACWLKGKQFRPGETYVDGRFWYTCVKTEDSVRGVLSGCVGDNGEKINPGGIFRSQDFVFTCVRFGNAGITAQPTACLYNGIQTLVGQEMMDENFVYACRRKEGNIIERTLVGCVYQAKKYLPGQQYIKDGFVFQCNKDGNRISHTIVGCLGENNKAFAIGQNWTEGTAPFKYVIECAPRPGGGVMKRVSMCAYEGTNGRGILKPGCMRRFDTTLVQCLSKEANTVEYRMFPSADESTEKMAFAAGFTYC